MPDMRIPDISPDIRYPIWKTPIRYDPDIRYLELWSEMSRDGCVMAENESPGQKMDHECPAMAEDGSQVVHEREKE